MKQLCLTIASGARGDCPVSQQHKKRYAESLEEARRNRITVQYEIEELTNDDAEWILEEAKAFVLEIESVLA